MLRRYVWSNPVRLVLCLLLIVAGFLFVAAGRSRAQDAVPTEILDRTFFIKVGEDAGTAFTIDHDGTVYLVTARHVISGLSDEGGVIQVWRSDKWQDYKTVRTLYPPSDKVDIAVLQTNEKVDKPYEIRPQEGKEGITLGQPVWFLGYPFGLGTTLGDATHFPFIKRGTASAVDASDPKAVVLYIDGFNNPGFSGGPILYYDFGTHAYRIAGVVKGYREDTAKIMVNGAQADTQILVNSGILIGYSIIHAIEAIEQQPKQP